MTMSVGIFCCICCEGAGLVTNGINEYILASLLLASPCWLMAALLDSSLVLEVYDRVMLYLHSYFLLLWRH